MLNINRYVLVASSVVAFTTVISLLPINVQAQCIAPSDLNGIWNSNDGGKYYVRQIGNDVWWVGMSGDNGNTWTNVFKGVKNGNTITGQWADVPRGQIRSGGVLNLNVQGTNRSVTGFTKGNFTGGFGGSQWFQNCNDVILNPVEN